jgi:hypothetical protein
MLSHWGSGRVEKRRLIEKNKRPVGGESSLRFDDLCERASKVDGGGSRAFTSSPGNRSTQRVIDLEGARTVTERLQPPAIVGGKLRGCDAKQLSGMYATASVKLPTAALALDRYFNAYGNFVLIVQAALRPTA